MHRGARPCGISRATAPADRGGGAQAQRRERGDDPAQRGEDGAPGAHGPGAAAPGQAAAGAGDRLQEPGDWQLAVRPLCEIHLGFFIVTAKMISTPVF